MDWYVITPAQARALGRMGAWKNSPKRLVTTSTETHMLIVVPPSINDRRRWDITPGGFITKKER